MERMKHLGLDLSLRSSGIVVYDDSRELVCDRVIHKSVSGYSLKKTSTEAEHIKRMVHIATAVCRVARIHDVGTVTIEGPAFNQKGQLFHLGGLHFVVQTQLMLARKLEAKTISSTAIRKVVFGRGSKPKSFLGNAKDWVSSELVKSIGFDLGEDNKNDALVVAMCRAKEHQCAG